MRGRTLSPDDEKKILTLSEMGMKGQQIADFLGLSRTTVYAVVNGKRQEYNENARKRRTPETAVQLTMETPEAPRRLEGDPHHLIITPEIREQLQLAVGAGVWDAAQQLIAKEKKNTWGLIYSAVLQAMRDGRKGGGQDGSREEEAGNGEGL